MEQDRDLREDVSQEYWSPGRKTLVSCLLEVSARKPGNVHPGASFADTHHIAFLLSAAAIAEVMDRASRDPDPSRGVGVTVWEAVQATRAMVNCNTNLGIILLLAPLVIADRRDPTGRRSGDTLAHRVAQVLAETTHEDAAFVLEAVRLAQPGGLGAVADHDVNATAVSSHNLRDLMALAADRDLIADEYKNNYKFLFGEVVPLLLTGLPQIPPCMGEGPDDDPTQRPWEAVIQETFLGLMALRPDSLIARKLGREEALSVQSLAQKLIASWSNTRDRAQRSQLLAAFDGALRERGHARNPGTTADLITAALYIALSRQSGPSPPPFVFPFPGAPTAWRGYDLPNRPE